jgi:hypothetical protein
MGADGMVMDVIEGQPDLGLPEDGGARAVSQFESGMPSGAKEGAEKVRCNAQR